MEGGRKTERDEGMEMKGNGNEGKGRLRDGGIFSDV